MFFVSRALISLSVFTSFLPPFPLSLSPQGWGRWKNSEYLQFISILEETKKNHTTANKVKSRQLGTSTEHQDLLVVLVLQCFGEQGDTITITNVFVSIHINTSELNSRSTQLLCVCVCVCAFHVEKSEVLWLWLLVLAFGFQLDRSQQSVSFCSYILFPFEMAMCSLQFCSPHQDQFIINACIQSPVKYAG